MPARQLAGQIDLVASTVYSIDRALTIGHAARAIMTPG